MSQLSRIRRALFGLAAIGTAIAAVPAQAQGDLLVAPTRVVMNGGGSAEVVLSNIGSAPATYRITVELRRMDGEGDFSDVAEESANTVERAALDMIRYARAGSRCCPVSRKRCAFPPGPRRSRPMANTVSTWVSARFRPQ